MSPDPSSSDSSMSSDSSSSSSPSSSSKSSMSSESSKSSSSSSDDSSSSSSDEMDISACSQDSLLNIPDELLFEAYLRRASRRKRKAKWFYNREIWEENLRAKVYTNDFETYNRMSVEAFDVLVGLLTPYVIQSDRHAQSSTTHASTGNRHNAIPPTVIVSSGLRFMAGELVKSIADAFKFSRSSCRRIIDLFLNAVMACEALDIRLPTEKEMNDAMDEWNQLSTARGALWGFIAAIDGWLACTTKPNKQDIKGNRVDYFSGHYHVYGLNVQAMCDTKLRYIYFTVAAPGSTGDARAVARCENLVEWINNLPNEAFVGGNNAYQLSYTL